MPAEGVVYLVGAGPGDPGLITVKGQRLLRQADVVVYDRLVSKQLVNRSREDAERIDVGKSPGGHGPTQGRINRLLVDRARRGKRVVRLKGGDPFLFGRGGEELTFCRESGVECHVVPGISSALAAPASLQIPLTHRDLAHQVVIVSGHSPDLDFSTLASVDTLVVLMGRRRLRSFCDSLVGAGKDETTPAAAVQWATTAEEKGLVAVLKELPTEVERQGLGSPLVIVIGPVVDLAALEPGKRAVAREH